MATDKIHQRRKIDKNIIIVAFVALASGFGQDLITPILPGFLVTLGISRAGIGLIDGLLQGATAFFRFASGIASDRFSNRKTLIFIGYAFSSVARPLLAFTGSYLPIAGLRILDGVGKGTKDAPRDALIADSSEAVVRGRAFGFQRLVDTAGSVLGPLLAGTLLLILTVSLTSYRIIFALSAIPGAIALGLILFGIREPQKHTKTPSHKKQKLPMIFWLFTLGTSVAMLTRINDSLFLVRAGDNGIPAAYIPILFGGFTFLYAILSYPIGILSDRIGRLPLIIAGWGVLALTEIGMAFSGGIATTIPLFALFGLFYALTEGSSRAIIADFVPSQSRGTAYAIFHSLTGLALIIGGYGLGRIWDVFSPNSAFLVAATGSMFGVFILGFSTKYHKIKTGILKI